MAGRSCRNPTATTQGSKGERAPRLRPSRGCDANLRVRPSRCEIAHTYLPVLGLSAVQQTALQERPHEDPTIGVLVVQVRRIRAISGDVFRRPSAASVTHNVVPAKAGTYTRRVRYEAGCNA